jgi:hypothetical protein
MTVDDGSLELCSYQKVGRELLEVTSCCILQYSLFSSDIPLAIYKFNKRYQNNISSLLDSFFFAISKRESFVYILSENVAYVATYDLIT